MASIGDIFMRMLLQTGEFEASARKEGKKAGEVAGKEMSKSLSQSLKEGIGVGFGIKLFEGLAGAISNVTGGVENLIATSLSKAGEMERFQVQFETILGSVDEARTRIAELVEFAATTPFELPEVINASRTLQVFTQGVLATGDGLRMVGDIAAGTGQPINDVAMWIGRLYDAMQSGRPFGEATMRLQEMGALSGDNRALIERLAASVKAGNMTMSEAWATTGGVFSQFAGLMDKQSQTLEGQFSNLADATGQSFAAVGDALMPIAKAVIPEAIALVKGLGDSISAFIRDHALELKEVVLDITNALFGFISGLFGIEKALTGTTKSVGAVAAVGLKAGMGFDEWRQATGNMPAALDKTTAATKAATTAIDKQIDSERERTDVQLAAIDAQEKQLDLAEEQIAIDERKRGLNEQLNDAQLALTEAMGGTDANAISEAMANVADIQEAQAKNEHDLGVDAQRDRLQMQRDEIQAKSQAKLDELNDLKQQLAAQKGATTSSNAETLSALKAQYATYLEEQKTKTTDGMNVIGAIILGQPKTGTGLGGAIRKSFEDGLAWGESFRAFITDQLVPAIQGILGVFGSIKQTLDDIANSPVWKFLNDPIDIPGFLGPSGTAPSGAGKFGAPPSSLRSLPFTGETFLPPSGSGSMSGFGGVPLNVTVISVLDGREVARSTGRVFADELRH